jgi:hypothetical protein
VNPDQENFNLDQGQISSARNFNNPVEPRSAVPAGFYFGVRWAWDQAFTDPNVLLGGRKLAFFEASMSTVWVYVDINKQVGHRDHLKVFANRNAADAWFAEHDPEGVAVEYEVIDKWPTFRAENI